MTRFSTSHAGNDLTIYRPALSAVVDPLRDLLKMPSRSPVGFSPAQRDTLVETIIDTDGCGIGPISVSTACEHLYCYTVRYEHGNIGTMMIAGRSVQSAIAQRSVHDALTTLHRQTLYHGPIVFHSLTTVETPRSSSGLFSSWLLHHGRVRLHETIVTCDEESLAPPPPLALIRLKLRGWLPRESSVPTCIFDGGAGPFMLHVAWGKEESDVEHIRLA